MTNAADGQNPAVDDQLYDLIVEFEERRESGESLSLQEFSAAHPEYATSLVRHFENVSSLERLAGPTASSSSEQTFITSDTQNASLDQTFLTGGLPQKSTLGQAEAPALQSFGRYQILKELGRGAMGAVYLAKDEQLDREVALKIPQFDQNADTGLLERFYREAKSAAALQHPGICPVFDVGEIDGQHYITMAYIKGRPLRDFTKSSKRQEGKQVARVVRKIAQAMAEAHEHNVIHRDLKPANVMMNTKNEPVVMDFGLARRSSEGEERLTHTGTIIGTPAYMSPEQVSGDQDAIGAASDIYSLGVIFYELLTGQLPFQGNLMAILHQVATKDPTPPTELHGDVDLSLQDLCLRMLAKKPANRPESMQQVADELTAWLSGRRIAPNQTVEYQTSTSSASQGERQTASHTQPLPESAGLPAIVTDASVTVASRRRRPSRETSPPAGGMAAQIPPRKNPRVLLAALGGIAVLLAGITFFVRLGKHDVQITLDDPAMKLSVDEGVLVIDGTETTIRLSDGPHQLRVEMDGFETFTDNFTVKKDGKTAVHVVKLGTTRKFAIDTGGATAGDAPRVAATARPSAGTLAAGEPPRAVAPFDEKQAKTHQEAWAKHLGVPVEKDFELPGGEKLTLVLIPPGEFLMGSSVEEQARALEEAKAAKDQWAMNRIPSEGPQHRVRITRPFWLGKYQVTQSQWQSVMGSNPSQFKDRPTHPVEMVSWDDIQPFLAKLNATDSPGEVRFALPTEAQWEYACRAGTTSSFSFGDNPADLVQFGWCGENAGGKTHPVGQMRPNCFNLYDMHGNGWEWCADRFGANYYEESVADDPTGPSGGRPRVHRGGGLFERPWVFRSALRREVLPTHRAVDLGFRLVLTIDTAKLKTAPTQATRAWDTPELQKWVTEVAGLPAEKQVEAVAGKIQELNPGFDGVVTHQIRNGIVTKLEFLTESVTDISPVRALTGLSDLRAHGSTGRAGKLTDLSPLQGLQLDSLAINNNPVTDLAPLQDVPLKNLEMHFTQVEDLSPLRGKDLTYLVCAHSKITDLSPLTGMPLRGLHIEWTQVSSLSALRGTPLEVLNLDGLNISDLSPLQGMPLRELHLHSTQVADLSPLQDSPLRILDTAKSKVKDLSLLTDLPLEELTCDFSAERDTATLRSIRSLKTINGQPVADFWKQVDGNGIGAAPAPAVAPFDEKQAKAHQKAWADHLGVPVEYTNSIGMKFRLIPPGEFLMGSTVEEIANAPHYDSEDDFWDACVQSEAPRHLVRISQPFYLAVNEVTQEAYSRIAGRNPSVFCSTGKHRQQIEGLDTSQFPVETVTWQDAVDFCNALSKHERLEPVSLPAPASTTALTGVGYRLPTEAEWEFACRAGTTTQFYTGDVDRDLHLAGYSGPTSGNRTHPVGELLANPFGLFDMHGNVWEFVLDHWDFKFYEQFKERPAIDPLCRQPASDGRRGVRGGFFGAPALRCTSARRFGTLVANGYDHIGFRVLLSVEAVRQAVRETDSIDTSPPAAGSTRLPARASLDRLAAEWVIAVGGQVIVDNRGDWISDRSRLPDGEMNIRLVKFLKPLTGEDRDLIPLRELKYLEFIGLDGTNVSSAGLAGLDQLPRLDRISRGTGAIKNEDLDALARLKTLRSLFLASTKLTASHCQTLARTMPQLTSLNLMNNGLLDDAAVSPISEMPDLSLLQLQGTKVTAAGVAALKKALPDCRIEWDDNQS